MTTVSGLVPEAGTVVTSLGPVMAPVPVCGQVTITYGQVGTGTSTVVV